AVVGHLWWKRGLTPAEIETALHSFHDPYFPDWFEGKKVIAGGLSVRATEALVKKSGDDVGSNIFTGKKTPKSAEKDADTRALENDLSAATGVKVSLTHKPDGEAGQLTLQYDTLDQLDDLCRRLSSS
ncbi:MAG: hypothetical protein AAF214_11055, partial [Pseudomonadota bacterium]